MAKYEEVRSILEEALKVEKQAEDNCDILLKNFKLNGFAEMVAHIENDEIKHQEMVKKLIDFLTA